MYCQINFIVIIVSLIVIWMSLCLSHLNLISSQPDLSVNFYQRVLSDFEVGDSLPIFRPT